MDIDAGRYLTGTPMDELAAEAFEQTIAAVSGTPTAGERAGHSQVSIWRDWRQTRPAEPVPLRLESPPTTTTPRPTASRWPAYDGRRRRPAEQRADVRARRPACS